MMIIIGGDGCADVLVDGDGSDGHDGGMVRDDRDDGDVFSN